MMLIRKQGSVSWKTAFARKQAAVAPSDQI